MAPIIPPTTPPAIAPAWLLWEGLGDAVGRAVGPAKDALVEGVLAGGVDTPEAPKIAPGPISGLSVSNVGERP